MTDLYPIGQPVTVDTTVVNSLDVPGDPTALVLTYGPRGGAVTTKHWPTPAEIVRDSAGVFHFDIPGLTTAGQYVYTWTATGTNAGVDFDVFDVFDPASYPRLVSFADAKAFVGLKGTADDALLDRMIGWASARILREVQAGASTVTERVTVEGRLFTLSTVPVQTITAMVPVTPYSPTLDVTALYVRNRLGGLVESYPLHLCGLYDVTYTAGYDSIPPGVDGATLTLIEHWFHQSRSHGSATYGDSGFVPDFAGLPNAVLNKLAAAPSRPPLIA